jgi:hypothetical protein
VSPSIVFVIGLTITLVSAFLVVLYLRSRLDLILVDICGTPERARFWTSFSNVTLILVPMIRALGYRAGECLLPTSVMQLADQLEQALIGLVGTVLALGFVLTHFIRRDLPQKPNVQERHAS